MQNYEIKSSSAIDRDMLFRISGKLDISQYDLHRGIVQGVYHAQDHTMLDVFYRTTQGNRATFRFTNEPLQQLLGAEATLRGLEKKTINILLDSEEQVAVISIPDAIESYRRTEDFI
ncbi:MAG TPA: hypothetical protein VK158_05685 [Acidobacteriota bacterium]|nr:hypothetical protein [Acidobacteriota bacterium]